ncbi:MAG: hypothetical protein U9N50_06770 [Pseudomonadota bacterium]|nr:hypothetical protein [Pseudomonadota bacterium]
MRRGFYGPAQAVTRGGESAIVRTNAFANTWHDDYANGRVAPDEYLGASRYRGVQI